MKRLNIKSMFIGIIIGSIGVTTVYATGGIKSAIMSDSKVTLDGNAVPLNHSLISVVVDDENETRLYMPLRGILEHLGYDVYWDEEHNTVNLISNPLQSSDDAKIEAIKIATETPGAKVSIDIKSLNAESYTELGIYTLSVGDSIHFDISATGSALGIGFVKSTETPTKDSYTYFEQRMYAEGTVVINTKNVYVPAELAGEYKLFVINLGENQLANIKGTVEITKANEYEMEVKNIKTAKTETIGEKKKIKYETIDLNINGIENALIAGKDTPIENYYYCAFGPYLYTGNSEGEVVFDVQNGVSGSMFIGTSPNKEINKGVFNTFTNGATYKGKIGIFTDDSGYYYVIIGAKDIKNFRGSIQIPIYS